MVEYSLTSLLHIYKLICVFPEWIFWVIFQNVLMYPGKFHTVVPSSWTDSPITYNGQDTSVLACSLDVQSCEKVLFNELKWDKATL